MRCQCCKGPLSPCGHSETFAYYLNYEDGPVEMRCSRCEATGRLQSSRTEQTSYGLMASNRAAQISIDNSEDKK